MLLRSPTVTTKWYVPTSNRGTTTEALNAPSAVVLYGVGGMTDTPPISILETVVSPGKLVPVTDTTSPGRAAQGSYIKRRLKDWRGRGLRCWRWSGCGLRHRRWRSCRSRRRRGRRGVRWTAGQVIDWRRHGRRNRLNNCQGCAGFRHLRDIAKEPPFSFVDAVGEPLVADNVLERRWVFAFDMLQVIQGLPFNCCQPVLGPRKVGRDGSRSGDGGGCGCGWSEVSGPHCQKDSLDGGRFPDCRDFLKKQPVLAGDSVGEPLGFRQGREECRWQTWLCGR